MLVEDEYPAEKMIVLRKYAQKVCNIKEQEKNANEEI